MISFVIPLYNEQESIYDFYNELISVVKKLAVRYEIIFVDDGSTDSSLAYLKKLSNKNKNIKIFSFRKNHGKAEALTFGFQRSKGDYVVTLDADLQDKPTEISKLLHKQKEGYDVVSGWRKNRSDSIKKIVASKLFNSLVSSSFGLKLHDYNCGLKVYTKDAAKSLRLYGGLHRFIPLLAYQQGFTVAEVAVIHQKRKRGKSKYGFSKLWRDLPDVFTMFFLIHYKTKPLHFFGPIGFLLFFAGSGILLYLTGIKVFFQEGIGDRPLLFLGLLLVLSGLQIFFTGFLADLFINATQASNIQEKNLDQLKFVKGKI